MDYVYKRFLFQTSHNWMNSQSHSGNYVKMNFPILNSSEVGCSNGNYRHFPGPFKVLWVLDIQIVWGWWYKDQRMSMRPFCRSCYLTIFIEGWYKGLCSQCSSCVPADLLASLTSNRLATHFYNYMFPISYIGCVSRGTHPM